MRRVEVVTAIVRAVETAEGWRRAVTPEAGAAWNSATSRELEAADDAVGRLRELAGDLGVGA